MSMRISVWVMLFVVAVSAVLSLHSGHVIAQQASASPDTPDQITKRIRDKVNAVLAEVRKQVAGGNVRQDVIAKMQNLKPLTDAGKLEEAEALLDEAIDDLGFVFDPTTMSANPKSKPMPDGTTNDDPASIQERLQIKAQATVAEYQRRAGDVPQDVADRFREFGGLMETKNYGEAEQLVDGVLEELGIDPSMLKASDPAIQPSTHFTPFVKSPASRPVIGSGTAGVPTFLSDPCVIEDESGYHAFFSVYYLKNKEQGKYWYSYDPARESAYDMGDGMGGIGYAHSSDRGLTWTYRKTPLLTSGPEAWQDHAVETAHVIKVDDRLLLFYCAVGENLPNRYQIGVAEIELIGKPLEILFLDDSIVPTKRKEPILPIRIDKPHHTNNTQEPSAILRDGKIDLYFIGLTLSKPAESIGGENQITGMAMYKAVFDLDLQLEELGTEPVLEKGANITEVHYHEGLYHAFSTHSPLFADYHKDESIVHFVSKDGKTWSEGGLLVEGGNDGAFDSWGIMAPTVVFEEDHVVLFYTAWENEDRSDLPASSYKRFGMQRTDGSVIHGTLGRAVARLTTVEQAPASMPERL